MHAENVHGKTLEECFPGAAATGAELALKGKKPSSGGGSAAPAGPTKKERQAKANAGLDDLLSAGLGGNKKKAPRGKK